jgi:hypothetical protein
MSGVAQGEAATGLEERGNHSGRITTVSRERCELRVEQANEFFLVQAIYKAAHQRAQVGCRRRDRVAVAGNVGEEHAANTAGRAAGTVVDIAAPLRLAKRLAVYPRIEAAQLDTARCKLAAAPDFHALHVLRVTEAL